MGNSIDLLHTSFIQKVQKKMKLVYDIFYWVIMVLILVAFGFFLFGALLMTSVLTILNWIMTKFNKMIDRKGPI